MPAWHTGALSQPQSQPATAAYVSLYPLSLYPIIERPGGYSIRRISAATTKSPSLQAKSETITTPRTQWTRRHCQSGLASPALLHSSWQRRCSRSIRRTQDGSRRSFRSCRRGRSRQLRAARRRAARRRSPEVQYRRAHQGRVLCAAILLSYSSVARAARAAPANGADLNWVISASPTTTRPANPPRAHHQDNVSRDKLLP